MATTLVGKEIGIARQEGNKADVVLWVPAYLSLLDYTPKFEVRNLRMRVLISKSHEDMIINGQQITIPLLPEDTRRRAGKHRWELELTGEDGPVTIGKGVFLIINTDI